MSKPARAVSWWVACLRRRSLFVRGEASHRPGPVPFNQRLWFGVTGFLVIAILGFGLALLLSRFVSDRMLHREAEVTREFLESVLRAEESAGALFDGGTIGVNPQLASFVGHIRAMPDMLRANVYARDLHILWSTDGQLIGQRFEQNDELEAALRGELVTEVGELSEDRKAEHANLGAGPRGLFIEAYIPIRHAGRVVGVVELYKMPNALEQMLRDARHVMWASAAGAALVLFLALFWVVHRGARVIELQQSELGRMQALAAVGQMAGAIAHSLRNPMAGIRSSAELMRMEQPDGSTLPDDIIAQIDRMDVHVRELLDYARSDAPRVQPLDLAAVVAEVVGRLDPELARAGIRVAVEDCRARPGALPLDPRLLAQAVETIVTNAIEAMPQGGSLAVRLEDRGQGVGVSFTDSGPGIPAELLARVSEPFFTTKTRGLGLGLSIARRIVERFGGRLEITSLRGQGTTVRMELP